MSPHESRIKILSDAPVVTAIFTMALPVMFGMLVQVFYNMADTFFIGKMNDVNQLAAAGIGFPFFMLFMAFGSIIGVGASSIVSRYLGMKKFQEAGEVVSLSMILVLALSAFITIVALLLINPIIAVLGARAEVATATKAYVVPLVIGTVCILGNFALGVILRAEGAALSSMKGMLIGTIVNIILDPVMIFLFGWGIAGAAWATVIGNLSGLVYYLSCYTGKSILKLNFTRKIFRTDYLRGILAIGIPSGLNMGLMSVSGIMTNNLAAAYGATILAAMGIGGRITSLIILLLVGLATGCQPLIGYNYGAKNKKRLYQILKTSMIISTVMGTILLALFTVFGKYAIAVFTTIPEVIETGTFVLRAMSVAAPIIGIIMICVNSLQALGKALPTLILSTGRQGIFYLPLLFLLNGLFGFTGLIFTQAIVDVLMMVTATLILRHVLKTDPALTTAPQVQ
jgi:multidrug efflux pump